MIITKLIELGIDIIDPISIYSNPKDNIMNILIDRFKGKCMRSCFIEDIIEVVKISECVINQDGVGCYGSINVIFKVKAIVYAANEIINGCVVNINQKNGLIVCSAGNASIVLSSIKELESIQKDQIISIRVTKAKYNIGAAKIAISAVPYLFVKQSNIYKIPNDFKFTKEVKTFLQSILEDIKLEEERMEKVKVSGKSWEFFQKLLYAYNGEQQPPTGAKVVNLLELVRGKSETLGIEGKYIARDPKLDLSFPNIYVHDNLKDFGSPVREEVIPKDVLLSLLDNYYNHIRTVREMTEIYNTEEVFNGHKNLWRIFTRSKF